MKMSSTDTNQDLIENDSELNKFLCLVCNEKVEVKFEDLEENNEIRSEKLQSLYWIFLGHLKVTNDMSDFDFLVEPFPFCKHCTTLLIDLSKVHRKSTSSTCKYNFKQKKIDKIIAQLSCKIIKSYHSNNFVEPLNYFESESNHQVSNSFDLSGVDIKKEPENDRLLDLLSSTRKKVHTVRKSIYDAFNVSVSVDRISEESDQTNRQQLTLHTDDGLNDQLNFPELDDDDIDMDIDPLSIMNIVESDSEIADEFLLSDESDDEFDDLLPTSDDETDNDIQPKVSSQQQPQRQSKSRGRKSGKNENKSRKCRSSKPKSVAKVKETRIKPREPKQKKSVQKEPKVRIRLPTVTQVECDNNLNYKKFLYDNSYAFELHGQEYKCRVCNNYTGYTRKNIVQHMRNQHAYVGKFPCSFCDRIFSRLFEKKTHELSHSTDTPFLCSECGKCFKSMRLLDIHSKIDHDSTGPWKHTCHCGQKFRYERFLLRHQRVHHTGEKPFKCPICERCFALKDSQLRHTRTHLESKPFLCDQCPSSFDRGTRLKVHVERVHNSNKPSRRYTKRSDKWKKHILVGSLDNYETAGSDM